MSGRGSPAGSNQSFASTTIQRCSFGDRIGKMRTTISLIGNWRFKVRVFEPPKHPDTTEGRP